ncbi:mediator of RNA polymerase II transcription subunit 30-like [Lineus longissimus]|uniref:mediator of RNA polymerase II transcription subunit 30-like n=1 Tax=Lineus longissimus TaxID=88925 RepID=UPI002B4E5041
MAMPPHNVQNPMQTSGVGMMVPGPGITMMQQQPAPQYHQMMQQGMPGPPPGVQMQQMMGGMPPGGPPQKEIPAAYLCRLGQEAVQEIVHKTMEIFQTLKQTTLPNGTTVNMQNYQDRRAKLEDHMKKMTICFNRLRNLYTRVNDTCTMITQNNEENFIPYEDEDETNYARQTDIYQYSSEERKEVIEQVRLKNRQLKEVIDQLRTVIWEINTMMAMRHT